MSNNLNDREMEGFTRGTFGHLESLVRNLADAAAESGADMAEATLAEFGGADNEPSDEEYVPYVRVGIRRPLER